MGQHAVVYEGSRHDLRLPRPGVAALPLLGLAVAAAALDAAPDLPWLAGAAVAALFVVAAGARASQQYLELRRLRATADNLILRDAARVSSSAFLEWRASELTAPKRRRALGRSLHHVVRELNPGVLPGSSPLNRRAARPFRERFSELARIVDDPSCDISARGVLLLEALLTDSAGPLYDRARADALPGALQRVGRALRSTDRPS